MTTLNVPSFEIVFPIFAGTIVFGLLAIFIIYFIFLYNKTQQKFSQERQHYKETLLQTEIEIREQTLKHVSRELHDNLGHIASLIKINLNMMSKELEGQHKAKLEESVDLLKQLIADIKSLSVSLNNDNLKRSGLKEALVNTIVRINRTGNISMSFEEKSPLPVLKPEVELILFRMLQEIFNNTLQHAGASEALLIADTSGKMLLLEYSDNGKGFNTAMISSGSGLSNLVERSNIIGAGISIESKPGNGIRIYLSVPIPI